MFAFIETNILQVGAVEGDEELTPLGHHLAKLPVDVLIGKVCNIPSRSFFLSFDD